MEYSGSEVTLYLKGGGGEGREKEKKGELF